MLEKNLYGYFPFIALSPSWTAGASDCRCGNHQPQLAQADGECFWFTADKIVEQCSTADTSGRLFKPAAVGLAISCGAPECQGARGADCIEFGVGPQSEQPTRWAPNADFGMEMAMAWVTNSPSPGNGILATSGAAGPGSPFDACEAVLKDAAGKLGY